MVTRTAAFLTRRVLIDCFPKGVSCQTTMPQV
jgi:hypothetical protein